MNLLRDICLSNWTGKDVHSYEAKGSMVMAAVLANILTLHEAHVGLKRERVGKTGAEACAADTRIADEAIEIGDFGRLIDTCKRSSGAREGEMVNHDSERGDAAGNGVWKCGSDFIVAG